MPPTYHRKESPSQTKDDAFKERDTGELWGRTSRYGGLEARVEAYDGPLPQGAFGVEFTTEAMPDKGAVPGCPVWSKPPAVDVIGELTPTVKIPIIVLKIKNKDGTSWIKSNP